MALTKWAFIYTLSTDSDAPVFQTIGDEGCALIAVGVPSTDMAAGVVSDLIEDGVQLIELCGAFGPQATANVESAIGGRIPFGAVTYPCSEGSRLSSIFDTK